VRNYLKIARRAVAGPWSIAALCVAYDWPTNLAGGGKIGIVELGGGWVQSDLDAFSSSNKLPQIIVTDVSVDGTLNSPGNDADVEVALDIEVAAVSYYAATGKMPSISVYWSQDIATAIQRAAADGCRVVSISWGESETGWSSTDMEAMQAIATSAALSGCTIFAASGDNDADDDDGNGQPSVDCPASCPAIIGCGGTSKIAGGAETVWNNSPPNIPSGEGTGGGFSAFFPAQSFQVGAPKAPAKLGRMVPDIAACADPNTGYEIFVKGSSGVVGGTSAVAPLYAGLFAAINPSPGVDVLATLWKNAGAFTDITVGSNGLYSAATGADPCTGLGVPNGKKIAALFGATPVPSPGPTPTPTPEPTGQPTLAQIEAALTRVLANGFPVIPRSMALKEAIAAVQALPGWNSSKAEASNLTFAEAANLAGNNFAFPRPDTLTLRQVSLIRQQIAKNLATGKRRR